jgi:hypothetical protein
MIGGGPYIKMTDAMNRELQHVGLDKSCGACALQYLGLPKNIIDNLVRTAEGYTRQQASGLEDINMRNNIRSYENTFDYTNSQLINNSCPRTQIYLYGANLSSNAFNPIINKILIDDNNQYYSDTKLGLKPLTNELIEQSLNEIYKIIPPGYATIVGVTWRNSFSPGIIGHYTVFAKGMNNNLYLIENQGIGNEGIYKNPDEIREYFKSQGDIAYFVTFECGKLIDSSSEKWLKGRRTTYDPANISDIPQIERLPSTRYINYINILKEQLMDIFLHGNIPQDWSNTQYPHIIQYKDQNIYAFNDGNQKYIFIDLVTPKIVLTLNDAEILSRKQNPQGWVDLQGGIYQGQYQQIYDSNVNILKIPTQQGGKKSKKTKKKNKKRKGKTYKK